MKSSSTIEPESETRSRLATRVPPDEKFWQRYSARHELPLSTASSILVHGLVLAVLVLGGVMLAKFGFKDKPVDLATLVVGDPEGGQPDGHRPGKGLTESIQDRASASLPLPPITTLPQPVAPTASPDPLLQPKKVASRPIESTNDAARNLDQAKDAAVAKLDQAMLEQPADNGQPGQVPSSPGPGDQSPGPGKNNAAGGKKLEVRKARQQRWVMIFNTRDGEDYCRQLAGLKAILAVPDPKDAKEYLFINDLAKRKIKLEKKDLTKIDRIYWVDDNAESVASLARALHLSPAPKLFVAFFSEEVEKQLLKKELDYKNTPEDQIDETRFEVRLKKSGRGYEPVVIKQSRKGH